MTKMTGARRVTNPDQDGFGSSQNTASTVTDLRLEMYERNYGPNVV